MTSPRRWPRSDSTKLERPATEATAFRPWSFFLLAGLLTSVVAVFVLRGRPPAALGLVVFTLAAAGLVGLATLRLLSPLVGRGPEQGPTVHGRARAALERDKALTLRAIKELEFDRAMGKVAEPDFVEMRDRLRQRALRVMRQLDGGDVYRPLIERDVAAMVGTSHASSVPATGTAAVVNPAACLACGTVNDADARFCKHCGELLRGPADAGAMQGRRSGRA